MAGLHTARSRLPAIWPANRPSLRSMRATVAREVQGSHGRTRPGDSQACLFVSRSLFRSRFLETQSIQASPQRLASVSNAGVHLGVCTSRREDYAEKILRMFGIREHTPS